MSHENHPGRGFRMPDVVKFARSIKSHLDPADHSDHITSHERIVALGQLAKYAIPGALAALAIAGRFGYHKWRHVRQEHQFTKELLANRLLLKNVGEDGRQKFLANLTEAFSKKSRLNSNQKIRLIEALTNDDPVDMYGGDKGGFGVHNYDDDGVITERLNAIQGEIDDPEIAEKLAESIMFIAEKKRERARRTGR